MGVEHEVQRLGIYFVRARSLRGPNRITVLPVKIIAIIIAIIMIVIIVCSALASNFGIQLRGFIKFKSTGSMQVHSLGQSPTQ